MLRHIRMSVRAAIGLGARKRKPQRSQQQRPRGADDAHGGFDTGKSFDALGLRRSQGTDAEDEGRHAKWRHPAKKPEDERGSRGDSPCRASVNHERKGRLSHTPSSHRSLVAASVRTLGERQERMMPLRGKSG